MKKIILAVALGTLLIAETVSADVDKFVNNSSDKIIYTCSDESGIAFRIEKKQIVSKIEFENKAEFINLSTDINSTFNTIVKIKSVQTAQFLNQLEYLASVSIAYRTGIVTEKYKILVSESVSFADDATIACGRRYCPPKTTTSINAKIIPENKLANEKIFNCHI